MPFEFIPEIMRGAAKIMLSAHDIDSSIKVKPGDANFVTAYDVAVEDYLYSELAKALPEAVFIGEESDDNHTEKFRDSLAFVIDPIDGTTNFIHNFRFSAISVALCDRGEVIYGAIYNPYSDLMYNAERGKGAFVTENGTDRAIRVSGRALKDGLGGFGTSPYYREELGEATFRAAYRMFGMTRDVRRCGSAALDLAAVASGMLDVFFEYRLSPWDFAAGSLIITEAGGVITQIDGSPVTPSQPCSVLAGSPQSHAAITESGILAELA